MARTGIEPATRRIFSLEKPSPPITPDNLKSSNIAKSYRENPIIPSLFRQSNSIHFKRQKSATPLEFRKFYDADALFSVRGEKTQQLVYV